MPSQIARYLAKIQEQEASERPYILHYDHVIRDLRPWHWPISKSGGRIMPSQLPNYDVPGFLRPCCLCGVPLDGVTKGYVESVIAIAHFGERSGEYVARCATEACDYEVYIEKAYGMIGMLVRHYGDALPASDRQTRSMARLLQGRTVGPYSRAIKRGDDRVDTIRVCAPRKTATPFSKLLGLDSYSGPGLSEKEFRNLFTKCRSCKHIMTHKAFGFHACPG